MKRQAQVLVICIALAGVLASGFVSRNMGYRPEARREMRHFLSLARLGDTKAQVRQKFKVASYKTLDLRDNLQSPWSISTPFEFGAGNWILWLEFDRDTLRATRLRIADGAAHRPRDAAPPDRIAPG